MKDKITSQYTPMKGQTFLINGLYTHDDKDLQSGELVLRKVKNGNAISAHFKKIDDEANG